MTTIALIVGAGSGARMGAGVPKAFLPLAGRPMVDHSLAVFDAHPAVDSIVLVAPAADLEAASRLAAAYPKVTAVAAGGARRQDSVRLGLDRVAGGRPPSEDDLVLVHDAARPLLEPALITSVIEAAARHGAAVPGLPPSDTVRRAGPAGADGARRSTGALDRTELVLVQTPQGFRLSLLREAYERLGQAEVTDDAALVERLGRPVAVVAGSSTNLKVTTPQDLDLAEALLRRARPPRGG